MTSKFYMDGMDKADQPYVYRLSGLDDVVLLNGFTRHETEYGDAVSIDAVDALHNAIALHIITAKKALSPKEFRFLRTELGMTQDELGTKIGVDGQTIARYEKGSTQISGPADRLLRVLIILRIIPEDKLRAILKAAEDAVERDSSPDDAPARFREAEGAWEEVCVA
ncbi:helix-turn-helix domain-containing protein [Pseudooceanicola sp. 502str34]